MAIKRSNLFYSGQRLDIPQFRSIESAAQSDSDTAWGSLFAGRKALIIKGFTLSVTPAIIGAPASQLVLNTAGGALYHYNATAAGTFLEVDADQAAEVLGATNTRVLGGFISNTTNYVSINLVRVTDINSVDTLQFIDPDTNTQFARDLPIARVFDYRILISNIPFGNQSYACPVAKVVTDANNNVVSVTDARSLCYRLGDGGTTPSTTSTYPWNTLSGLRTENPLTSTTGTSSPFLGTDKTISSFSDWSKAVMTRLWETGGGEHWYSATTDKNIHMALDTSTAPMADNFEFNGTQIRWSGIKITFDNSTGAYNAVNDQVVYQNFPDGYALYVDLDRTQNAALNAQIAPLITLGMSTIPGARYILAWRVGAKAYARDYTYWIGRSFPSPAPATTTLDGIVYTVNDPGTNNVVSSAILSPIVPIIQNDNTNTLTYLAATAGGLTRGNAFPSGGYNGGIGAGTLNIARGSYDTRVVAGDFTETSGSIMAPVPGSNNLDSLRLYTRYIYLNSGAAPALSYLPTDDYPIEIDTEASTKKLTIGGTNSSQTIVDGGICVFGQRSSGTIVGATGAVIIGQTVNTTSTTVTANGPVVVSALAGAVTIDASSIINVGSVSASQVVIKPTSRTTVQGNGSTNPELAIKTTNATKGTSPILRVQNSVNTALFEVNGVGDTSTYGFYNYINPPGHIAICNANDMVPAAGNVVLSTTPYTLANAATLITYDATGHYQGPHWLSASTTAVALSGRVRIPARALVTGISILTQVSAAGTANNEFYFTAWNDTYNVGASSLNYPFYNRPNTGDGFTRVWYTTTSSGGADQPYFRDFVGVATLPYTNDVPFWIQSGTNGLTCSVGFPVGENSYVDFMIVRNNAGSATLRIFAVAINYTMSSVQPSM